MGRRVRAALLLVFVTGCAPRPAPVPISMPDPEVIIRACVVLDSCGAKPAYWQVCPLMLERDVADNSVGTFFGPAELRRILECTSNAADCASARDCFERGYDQSWCDTHLGDGCDGDLLITCGRLDSLPLLAIDCRIFGMTCGGKDGVAHCTDGVPCDPFTPVRCDGNRYVTCPPNGLESAIDCSQRPTPDSDCRIAPQAQGHSDPGFEWADGCLPSGPACTQTRCDGDVLVQCGRGEEMRRDCRLLEGHCGPTSYGSFDCFPDATECDPQKDVDQCDGNNLKVCYDGRFRTFDCTTLGLSGCAYVQGTEPGLIAVCQ